jgi:hypothetical protein
MLLLNSESYVPISYETKMLIEPKMGLENIRILLPCVNMVVELCLSPYGRT